jgi:hypothetical protein
LVSANAVQGAPAGLAASICTGSLAGVGASTGALAAKTLSLTALQKALVVAAVAMVGAGITVLTFKALHASRAAHLNAQHNIQGAWQGTLFTGSAGVDKGESAKTRVVLKLTKENGDYKAMVDAIDWGRKNMPATIDYTFPSLRLTVNPQMVLDGRVNAEGTVMNFNGTVLHRTDTPDTVPAALTEAEFLPRVGSDLQGYWKGTIDVKPNPLPLNWKIAEQADGSFRAELDNPHQGALGQPARVVYTRPTVELVLMSRNGMVRGEINRDNTEIKGSFIQGGQAVQAIFKREDYAADQAQEALKDYSFRSENDLQGHWQGLFLLREKPVFPVRLELDIARLPDGAFSATAASIYHLGNDGPRPASEFRYSAPEVRIAWQWMDDRFEGKLQKRKLIGTWFHGGRKWPLVFERKH